MDGFHLDVAAVRAFCVRHAVPHVYHEPTGQLLIPRPLEPQLAMRVLPRSERGMLTLAMPLPGAVAPERQAEVASALNLANSSSFAGAWVLNTRKGEIYFRLTLPTEGVSWTDESLQFALKLVVGSVETLGARILRVASGEAPAESVLTADGA